MPPVLGPVSPSPTRLKSRAAGRATARRPSQTASTLSSGPVRPSSITTRRPASPKAEPSSLARTSAARLVRVGGHEHALAGGEPVGLDHPRVRAGPSRKARAARDLVGPEGGVAGGRHAGGDEDLLHPGLGALQPGAVGARAEHHPPGGAQTVGEAVDERRLRADHVEVGVDRLRRPGDALGHVGDAGVARRAHHLRRAGQAVGQGVLAPAAARRRRRALATVTPTG